jgi:hypothetical protein
MTVFPDTFSSNLDQKVTGLKEAVTIEMTSQ